MNGNIWEIHLNEGNMNTINVWVWRKATQNIMLELQ